VIRKYIDKNVIVYKKIINFKIIKKEFVLENNKEITSNSIKIIAIIAMTIDHVTWKFCPGFQITPLLLFLHLIGRLAAPIMMFFIVEGYYHTKNIKKYIFRLFLFAIISHIPFALPLSKYFKKVYAIDWEKEMIDEGKRISNELGIQNIKWMIGKAEELNINPDFIKLITIGDAFHRFDQLKILQNSYKMLKRRGHLVLIYSGTIDNGNTEWQKEIKKVISSWKKVNIKNNDNIKQPWDLFLHETNYINVAFREFEKKINVNIETIIGYLYSMSVYSKNIIGDKYQLFENEIKEKLMKIEPKNNFEFNFKCGYYIGEKK